MTDAPKSPADPRPNNEPYYIDSDCPRCGTNLVLYDRDKPEDEIWYDEWECPECQEGIYVDWPPGEMLEWSEYDPDDFVPLDDVDL